MKFEYYVLHHDFNKDKIFMWNIFNNWVLQEGCEKSVKKYLRNKKKFTKETYNGEILYGYDAFKEDIRTLIMWRMWSKVEYEISVTDPFPRESSNYFKIDAYDQCLPNMDVICHEVIRQYKEQKKSNATTLSPNEQGGLL